MSEQSELEALRAGHDGLRRDLDTLKTEHGRLKEGVAGAGVLGLMSRSALKWAVGLSALSCASGLWLVFHHWPGLDWKTVTGFATAIPATLGATVLFFRSGRMRDWRFLDQMTAEQPTPGSPGAPIVAENILDWSQPKTHLRFNARRMRWNSSLALAILLVAIVLALAFYAFADVLSAWAHTIFPSLGDTSNYSLLAARIGVGGIMIFTVQILAGIYRYSIRMTAFYEGRATALMIAREFHLIERDRGATPSGATVSPPATVTPPAVATPPVVPLLPVAPAPAVLPATATSPAGGSPSASAPVNMKDIVDWFAGDKVEFDKAPKAPTELLAEVAKVAAEAVAKVKPKD